MGFSTQAILIKPAIADENSSDSLKQLGFDHIRRNGKVTFEQAALLGKKGTFMANFNGTTIIISDRVYSNLENANAPIEKELIRLFPHHEILLIANVESMNAYHYQYIVDGKTKRLKRGSSKGLDMDSGEELPEEKEVYVRKELMDGQQIYYTRSAAKGTELDRWTHDQLGGTIAFSLAKMLIGVEFTQIPLDLEMLQFDS